jgi:DNA-binding transcriptional MocR family regulator
MNRRTAPGRFDPWLLRAAEYQLAETYDFLILEDDAYGELGFTDIPPPLKAMDHGF